MIGRSRPDRGFEPGPNAMTTLSPTLSAQTPDRVFVREETLAAIGAATGAPALILRLEAAAVLALALAAYARAGQGWLVFAVLFLVPDLSMLGYFAGRRLGAIAYNVGHSYLVPLVLGATGLVIGQPFLVSIALIWIAHIGFDRLLGYGLKYATAFGHTHLGMKGESKAKS